MPADSPATPYPLVASRPDFPAIEREVLARWAEDGTFQASVSQREAGDNEYVFYDGPPFANGLPHYGHLLTSYAKDVIPRYQTMRGRRVERRFGWDCHGLPAEMHSEKELGIAGRQAITDYGIDRFNDHCRTSVQQYAHEWERYITRMARWVDFDNDYKTLDVTYMESVIWAFKQLHDKGLIYEGFRVMPYSWAAETPLSNFEIRQDDATRPKQHPALTVALRLQPQAGDAGPLELLIWTTTPWTLPSNLAVAVGPDVDYSVVAHEGRTYVIGTEALTRFAKELGEGEVQATLKGRDLVGRTYEPLFPYFAGHANAFQVLGAAFVDTAEGTGLVHMAPGFGEDDQVACEAAGIELVVPVDHRGRFTAEVSDYADQLVFDANPIIIKDLKARGVVLRHETIEHNYPHCWRTDQPIIYRALTSWYVRVTDFRDRMVELNQEVNWIPEHIRDGQFGRWLEGARDWSISRNRFWGAPIPVWQSDDPAYPRTDVYGSLDELEADFGVRLDDLHRPSIDALTRPNPDDPTGKSTMRRVPEVLDCWFESGAMPFAQVHYPFENREWFEEHFPADFIVEYIAQTRGWFYTLMVLSTALFDRPPFKNCLCHGIALAGDGRKLSKRLRNYPEPDLVFDKYGADALRWYMLDSPLFRGGNLQIDKDGKGIAEVVRLVLNPIWNAYAFFTLYANVDGVRAKLISEADDLLDRYALAKTRTLVEQVEQRMDAYDLSGACSEILGFLDALNNWYIRRSRPRFWAAGLTEAKQAAYDTLYTVLTTLCRVAAPVLPLIADRIYASLTGETSVHLADWPALDDLEGDPALVHEMDRVREVCSTGLMLREAKGLRARLPLPSVTVAGAGVSALEHCTHLIQDELNVKAVHLSEDLATYASQVLRPDGRKLGPIHGKHMREIQKAARAGDWTLADDGRVALAGVTIEPDAYDLLLQPHEGQLSAGLRSNDVVVVLDDQVTPALRREGMARDLIRAIQQARKDADLNITDRIEVTWALGDELTEAVGEHAAMIQAQVLAEALHAGEPASGEGTHTFEGTTEDASFRGSLRIAG